MPRDRLSSPWSVILPQLRIRVNKTSISLLSEFESESCKKMSEAL